MTVLYNDGTLIINEMAKDRANNISIHGTVTKEYEAMSNSNSYVMKSASAQPWVNERSSIKSVDLGQEISPVSTAHWFRETRNMETGDFTKLNTLEVTDMQSMFYQAGYNSTTFELKGLDAWDTSKVTNMNRMLAYAGNKASVLKLNLSKWDTSNVTDMGVMFNQMGQNATQWSIGDLSSWNVSNVTDMNRMFSAVGQKTIEFNIGDLSNWNVSKVINMRQMFSGAMQNCDKFKFNLSSWNTSQVTNMDGMFESAGTNAKEFDIGNIGSWDTSKITDMSRMFAGTGTEVTNFNIGDLSSWDTSQVTDMNSMFYYTGLNANSFNIGNIGKWDVSNVTNMYRMFMASGFYSDEWYIGDLSSWDTSKVTNMSRMFAGAGQNKGILKNIGTLSIPYGSDVSNFFYNDGGTGNFFANNHMSCNLIINGFLSSYTEMLRDAATNSSARINLYYKNDESEAIVDELISLYGPNGTVSKGNIYKVDE